MPFPFVKGQRPEKPKKISFTDNPHLEGKLQNKGERSIK